MDEMEQRPGESLEEMIARAEAQTEAKPWDQAETWEENTAGDKVAGKVCEVVTIQGKHGPFPLVVLEQADGTYVKVFAARMAIKDKVEQADPQPGDVLVIEYKGLVKAGTSGNEYHSYSVGHVSAGA